MEVDFNHQDNLKVCVWVCVDDGGVIASSPINGVHTCLV